MEIFLKELRHTRGHGRGAELHKAVHKGNSAVPRGITLPEAEQKPTGGHVLGPVPYLFDGKFQAGGDVFRCFQLRGKF